MNKGIQQRLESYGERPCLAVSGKVFSYEDLLRKISAAEDACKQVGIAGDDAVALIGNYNLDTIGWLLALEKHGCIIIPILETASPEEQAAREKIAGANWRIVAGAHRQPEKIPGALPVPALYEKLNKLGHAGLVLFSSGSTGTPKAMLHDLTTLLEKYADKRPKSLPVLAALLFDHIGGLNTLFGALASGQLLVCPGSHEPESVASLISGYKVAVLPTTPTFLNLLLLSGAVVRHNLSSLRVISYGTEPMPPALLHRLREAFPRVKFVETFGTSETGIAKVRHASGDLLRFDDTDMETRVVGGELWLRSKTQILGYLNHDMARFTDDGWFRTGDRVEVDAAGGMRILGRENDWINVGGEKVFPAEVESVILELPAVAECRVRGEANLITGQSVVAEVVPAVVGGDSDALKREVRKHCRSRLESFKVPTRVLAVSSLPVSERGKRVRNL